MSPENLVLSMATADSIPDMHGVYAQHVLHGTGSFEEIPPTVEQIRARWEQRESRNQPTLIAHVDNQFAGFAYGASHKERSAYRFAIEDSIYVVPEHAGKGVGRALLEQLIVICTERNFRQMIAVIGDSSNHGSIALHERCGFRRIGTATGIGYKFGSWLDVVYMQRALEATVKTE